MTNSTQNLEETTNPHSTLLKDEVGVTAAVVAQNDENTRWAVYLRPEGKRYMPQLPTRTGFASREAALEWARAQVAPTDPEWTPKQATLTPQTVAKIEVANSLEEMLAAKISKPEPTVKATSLNVCCLAETVRADGTIPSRVPASSHRHLKRCIDAGLAEVDGSTIRITEAGIEAIREDDWHKTNRQALERMGK